MMIECKVTHDARTGKTEIEKSKYNICFSSIYFTRSNGSEIYICSLDGVGSDIIIGKFSCITGDVPIMGAFIGFTEINDKLHVVCRDNMYGSMYNRISLEKFFEMNDIKGEKVCYG